MSGPQTFFKHDEIVSYDFSESPRLIRLKTDPIYYGVASKNDVSRWKKAQHSFINWTKDKKVFSDEYVRKIWGVFGHFFDQRGNLRGNVLDIGGGWGLYREWWECSGDNVFIVHDPGIERYLYGPHANHRKVYEKAFRLPMTFVEGFGERLPYGDFLFDAVLIVSTLDHCLDPRKVLSEAYRVLKPHAEILVVHGMGGQGNGAPPSGHGAKRAIEKVSRLFFNPRKLLHLPSYLFSTLRHILHRFTAVDHHIQVLSPDALVSLLRVSGFSRVEHEVISHPVFQSDRILIIQARK